ncbi:MAG: B12-binding domain-containing radical SAM protein [Promethearchaeota archaeon]
MDKNYNFLSTSNINKFKIQRILITSDRSLETTYRGNNFVGYLSSLPLGVIPKKIYNWFYPLPKVVQNFSFSKPHLSIRTIQSILIQKSACNKIVKKRNIKIIHPNYIEKVVKNNDLIFISTMDPLGIGPATSSWRFFSFGTPYHVYYFWDLIKRLNIVRHKKNLNFKIMIGGAGVWQIKDKNFMKKYGIDYIFEGEAEKTLCSVINFIQDEDNRSIKDNRCIFYGEMTDFKDFIPLIGPTNLSMIEITRGCGRMCQFCAPTRSGKMRSIPKEIILKTAKNFMKGNFKSFILNFQSEDTLRYNSTDKNFNINQDAVYNLYKDLFDLGIKRIFMTHATLSNIAAEPDFIHKLSNLLKEHGHKYYGLQPGIETGSTRLMKKLMKGKFAPLNDLEWSEIVLEALKICYKENWVPTASVILGLPGETIDDLRDTEILVRKLIEKDYFFIFAPLLFVPVPFTPLGRYNKPRFHNMSNYQKKIFKLMWKFNLKKIGKVWNVYNIYGYEFANWKKKILYNLLEFTSRLIL